MLKYLVAVIIVAVSWIAWAFLREVVPLWAPILVTVLAALVLLAILLIARVRSAQAARSLEKALSQQASQQAASARPDFRPKVEELQETFEKAVGALKESKFGRGRRGSDALYVLPWYLIIGPSGAGKTVAIKKSGLQFPHVSKLDVEQPQLRGLGGTRNCDWWLTNQAVLLDTTGRWVEDEEDRDEWRGFLGLLKKFRKKKPLNGLIVGVSVAHLAEASSAELIDVAQKVRKRIDEAMADLEMTLPVYVLFLKSDLISGFVETFGDLTQEERSVVLGFTEDPDQSSNPADRFEEHFGELIGSLESFTLRRLKEVNRLEARDKIFGFPQQMEELKPRLVDFIKQVFEENVFSASPMMRGAYFVSGTQEGRPFDLVLQKITDGYGLPLPSQEELNVEAKGYFLEKLFREVIFGDKDLAVRSEGERRRQKRVYYASVVSVFALAGLLLTVPAVSCVANRAMVNRVEVASASLAEKAQETRGTLTRPGAYLPLAEEIQTLYLDEEEGAPFRMRAGLYQGDSLIGPTTWFYGQVLEKNIVSEVFDAATASLKEFGDKYAQTEGIPSKAEYARSLDQLRLHLLLTGPKEQNEPPLEAEVANSLAASIAARWDQMLGLPSGSGAGEDTGEAAQAYVKALAVSEGNLGFPRNDAVVDRAQKALSRVSGMDLAIDGLIARYQRETPEITVRRVVGPGATSIAGRRAVRPAFTKEVWDEHIRDLLSGDAKDLIDSMWVLGEYATLGTGASADDEKYVRELRSRYLERYIDEWREFIRGVWIRPSPDTEKALSLLRQLTSGNPPALPRVFSAVATNVNLTKQQGDWWPFPLEACPETDSLLTTECDVLKAFEGFLRFGIAEPAQDGVDPPPTALQNYQEKLLYLRDAFVKALNDPSSQTLAQEAAVVLAETQGLIDIQEVGWRPALVALLLPPIESVIDGHWTRLAKDRGRTWCYSVRAPFDESLGGHYPLSRNTQMEDVSLADFSAFYAPGSGALWKFHADLLDYAIPRLGDTFQPRGPPGAPYSPGLPRFLSRSWKIASIFPGGATAPRINMQARIRPSPEVSVQALSIGGAKIDYYNGPETWTPIAWPGEVPEMGAKIEIRGGGSLIHEIHQQGPWGFFRVLELGRARRHGSNSFTVVWRVGPEIRVEIDFRVIGENPFFGAGGGNVLELFRGPDVKAPRNIVRETPLCGG